MNLTGLTATATIGDWDKVEVNGDATIPDPIGNKTPARAAAGDFYMNDGTLVDKDAALTNTQKSACLGIVYWVGDITGEDPLLKRENPVALTDWLWHCRMREKIPFGVPTTNTSPVIG